MVKALEAKLGLKLNVSPDSHFMGALGASLMALDHALKGSEVKAEEPVRAGT
jgi:activator of 2-hydroxyglutaryl-CoA dehydratase